MKNIFIVGSKPGGSFPSVKPDVIYAANGAIFKACSAGFESTEIKGVVSNYIFCMDDPPCVEALEIIKGCSVEELVVVNALDQESEIPPEIKVKSVRFVSKRERFELFYDTVGWIHIVIWLFKNKNLKKIKKNLGGFFSKHELPGLKPSTGMLSLLLAIRENGAEHSYYLVGVGVDPNSNHFYSSTRYGDKHIDADTMILDELRKKGLDISS